MKRETADQLLAHLGNASGLPDLRLNHAELSGLDTPSGVVYFEWLDGSGELKAHALVAKYHTRSDGPRNIYAALQELLVETPELTGEARLWLRAPEEARDGTYGLFLTRDFRDDGLRPETFEQEIANLLGTSKFWQDEILPGVMKEMQARRAQRNGS